MGLSAVVDYASPYWEEAIAAQVMHTTVAERRGKVLVWSDGTEATEFVNCSYLGLDTEPDVLQGAHDVLDAWGIHFCCARSRLSIGPLAELEERLSARFGGRAITFPTVTAAHMSTLPLIAESLFHGKRNKLVFVFDRFAHASMQWLRPQLERQGEVRVIGHNALDELEKVAVEANATGRRVVYCADGVYSMGGMCPVKPLAALADRHGIFLYLDDAHGTGTYGARGEGWVLSELGEFPNELTFVTFSLAKGLGCNGGGVVVPTPVQEALIRRCGQTYAFSAPLDFAVAGAALKVLGMFDDGRVDALRTRLQRNVHHYEQLVGESTGSPIKMWRVGDTQQTIRAAAVLRDRGFFVSSVFFPVVPKDRPQLRVVITAAHETPDISRLVENLQALAA